MEIRSTFGERTRVQSLSVSAANFKWLNPYWLCDFSLSNQEVIPAPRLPGPMPKMEEAKPTLDSLVKKEDPTKFYTNVKPIGEG